MGQASQGYDLLHGHGPVAFGALGEIGDALRELRSRDRVDGLPVQAKLSGMGFEHARQHPQQGRLSRSVRPQKADDFSRRYRQVDPIENPSAAEGNTDCRCRKCAHWVVLRMLTSRYRKKGLPINAVNTPSLSSGPGDSNRTAMSAASVRAAPPSALAGNSAPGR